MVVLEVQEQSIQDGVQTWDEWENDGMRDENEDQFNLAAYFICASKSNFLCVGNIIYIYYYYYLQSTCFVVVTVLAMHMHTAVCTNGKLSVSCLFDISLITDITCNSVFKTVH